jgi:AcrR family transcriptional regulator
VVVQAAADLADEVGADRLTLAQLAERLGVRLPSLYKHVDGLDAVRRDLAVLAMTELADTAGAAAIGRAGGTALRAVAAAYRDFARRHPGRYAGVLRAPAGDDAELAAAAGRLLDVVLALLSGYGLAGDDAVDAARALRATLHGFVSLEAAGGFGMPRDVDRSFERLVDGLDTALRAWTVTPATAGLPGS